MEPTFSSKLMRDLATEPKTAYHHLGSESGQALIGLVADFRAALFAGDVPGGPRSVTQNGDCFELDWFVSAGCTLRTVITAFGDDCDKWKDAHRIRLDSITIGEEVLA
ncbi:hypothetical protein [Leisingera sp. JC11]|uniref:hypothetical protein n=1 Tax=Leisingera sp. JC11 TaxID=3042469 RepID=UPI00345158C1